MACRPSSGKIEQDLLSPDWRPKGEKKGAKFASQTVTAQKRHSILDLTQRDEAVPSGRTRHLSLQRDRTTTALRVAAARQEPEPPVPVKEADTTLAKKEFFFLHCLLLNKFSEDGFSRADASCHDLCRITDQAVEYVDYLTSLAEDALRNLHTVVPDQISPTIRGRLLKNLHSYEILKKDFFVPCRNTFEQGIKTEIKRKLKPDLDAEMPYIVVTQREDMVEKLKQGWEHLIRYLDQCRECLPAPSVFLKDPRCPELPQPSDIKGKTALVDMINKIQDAADIMGENWKNLEYAIGQKIIPDFIKRDTTYSVLLPINNQPLPPSCDTLADSALSGYALEKKRPIQPPSVIAKTSSVGVELDEKKAFATESEARAYLESQSEEVTGAVLPLSEGLAAFSKLKAVSSFDPKPSRYADFEPVSKQLLSKIPKRGSEIIRKVSIKLDEMRYSTAPKAMMTKAQKRDIKKLQADLQLSWTFWTTEFPSLQKVYSDCYDECLMRSREKQERTLKAVFKKLFNKEKPCRKRYLTESNFPVQEYFRPPSPGRFYSLPVGDSSGHLIPPEMDIIPPTPSPSEHSASPAADQSPEPSSAGVDLV